MDLALIITLLGTTTAIIGSVYGFLRNFKADINGHIDRLERRMDLSEKRMDLFKQELISMEERMFLMATGKSLEDAIIEERMRQSKVTSSN